MDADSTHLTKGAPKALNESASRPGGARPPSPTGISASAARGAAVRAGKSSRASADRGRQAAASGQLGGFARDLRGCCFVAAAATRPALPLRTPADLKEKCGRPPDGPARRLSLRESSSELMIDRSLASRPVRMQLTGPACLGKPPVRSDCPVALVLANSRAVARIGCERSIRVTSGEPYVSWRTAFTLPRERRARG